MPLTNLSKNLGVPSLLIGASGILLRKSLPWPVVLVLCYSAASGLLVAVAANGVFTVPTSQYWLGKDPSTGRISVLGYLLQWPYHTLLRARIAKRRSTSKEPLYNTVVPHWYLGGWPVQQGDLPSQGNLAQVDMTAELPVRGSGPYHNVPIYDTMGPSVEQTQRAVEWAIEQQKRGRDVYMFCQNGHGRSGVVMAAAMLASGHASSPKEAFALIQRQRPKVRFNGAQQAAFDAWVETYGKTD